MQSRSKCTFIAPQKVPCCPSQSALIKVNTNSDFYLMLVLHIFELHVNEVI